MTTYRYVFTYSVCVIFFRRTLAMLSLLAPRTSQHRCGVRLPELPGRKLLRHSFFTRSSYMCIVQYSIRVDFSVRLRPHVLCHGPITLNAYHVNQFDIKAITIFNAYTYINIMRRGKKNGCCNEKAQRVCAGMQTVV